MPLLILGILVILAIGFLIKHFFTIATGIFILMIIYIYVKNKNFRRIFMGILGNVSKKISDFYDENLNN